MATYRVLASSCDEGPCPTFHIDDATGDVLVEGYVTSDQPVVDVPSGETVVRIDAAAWHTLTSQLGR